MNIKKLSIIVFLLIPILCWAEIQYTPFPSKERHKLSLGLSDFSNFSDINQFFLKLSYYLKYGIYFPEVTSFLIKAKYNKKTKLPLNINPQKQGMTLLSR